MAENQRETLRAELRQRRAGTSAAWRAGASEAICRRLTGSEAVRDAASLGLYLACGAEPDLTPLIRHAWKTDKRTWVPVIERDGKPRMRFARFSDQTPLARNRFGIREPSGNGREYIDPSRLDLVLVPLVGFDRRGNRLGMGGGYYDRCFAFRLGTHAARLPRLCGIAFAFQEFDELLPSPWDVPLDMVATEKELINVTPDHRRTKDPGERN